MALGRCSDGSLRRHGNKKKQQKKNEFDWCDFSHCNGELWTNRFRTIGDPDIVSSLRAIVEISEESKIALLKLPL
jgi:hypothetical protein